MDPGASARRDRPHIAVNPHTNIPTLILGAPAAPAASRDWCAIQRNPLPVGGDATV